MNVLHINTAEASVVSVILDTPKSQFKKDSQQKFGSQALLGLIVEVLKEAGIEMKDLNEVKVATGPGSYTGLKVGVAVANSLGFSLGIPVNGKKIETELLYS